MNNFIFNNIFYDILEISDENLQRELWLGQNPLRCSSFEEVMCRLFDDNDFSSFVNSIAPNIGFSDDTLKELKHLFHKLSIYKEKENNRQIIEDPEWNKIRQIASVVIQLWRRDELMNRLKYKILPR